MEEETTEKRKRGAPIGSRNAAKPLDHKSKKWAETLRRALLSDDSKKLRQMADTLIEIAIAGDVQAIKEIGDRIDGKAVQAITGELTGDITVEIVRYGTAE